MPYFVIHSSEDGISIQQMTAAQVLDGLTPPPGETSNEWGTVGFHTTVPGIDKGCFMEPEPGKLLIIEGRIVVPRPKTVIQEWEL